MRYFVHIQVIGTVFKFEVKSRRQAELEVERIRKEGYVHREGNARVTFMNVASVVWEQRE